MKPNDKVRYTLKLRGHKAQEMEGVIVTAVDSERGGVWEVDFGGPGKTMHLHESALRLVEPEQVPVPVAAGAAAHPLVGFKGLMSLREPILFQHEGKLDVSMSWHVEVLGVREGFARCAVMAIATHAGTLALPGFVDMPEGTFVFIAIESVVGLTCRAGTT